MINDYKPIANGIGANVESQAQYVIDLGVGGSLVNGYLSGLAKSEQMNKTWRQSSMIASAVAQMISDEQGIDVLDDGNLATLVTNLKNAITTIATAVASVPVGVVDDYVGTTAPAGYVLADGNTIGDASSGATERANADTVNLFTLLWNGWANAQAPVSGGRGVSAAADFAAHKTITLPDTRGRAIHGLDNLGGTAANRVTNAVCGIIGTTMGAVGGDQNVQQHTHTVNDPGHVHGINDPGHSHTPNVILSAGGGSQDPGGPNNTPGAMNSATTGITIVSANTGITNANFGIGSSANMSPAIMMTKIIKL